ncbi:hypothetical protein HK102_000824 [Quaeritorhiza haematococci]|nr:hypothetical protein HK102_000824 [Quaeritorhiza haematococci]
MTLPGKPAKGVVHNDVWLLHMSTEVKQLKWERRKKSGSSPRCVKTRFRCTLTFIICSAFSTSVAWPLANSLRSGCTMIQHKGKGIMFGGVTDVVETEEQLESVCHNEMFGYNLDANRWYPITTKSPKQSKRPKKAAQAAAAPSVSNGDEDEDDSNEEPSSQSSQPKGRGTSSTGSTNGDETVMVTPPPRYNTMMTMSKNTLYLLGGMVESGGSKEFTLGDLWTVNLEKLDGWNCIVNDPEYADWSRKAEVESEDEDDEDDDEDDDDEDDEDEDEEEDEDRNGSDEEGVDEENEEDGDKVAKKDRSATPTKENGRSSPKGDDKKARKAKKKKEEKAAEDAETTIPAVTQGVDGEVTEAPAPLPGETLREFFKRTASYWERKAYADDPKTTGKGLRTVAFQIAQITFDEWQPKMEEIKRMQEENEVEMAGSSSRTQKQGSSATRLRR